MSSPPPSGNPVSAPGVPPIQVQTTPHLDGWLRACWPSSATARGLGGGNDKLAIDKGGNLPEKVENHWIRPFLLGQPEGIVLYISFLFAPRDIRHDTRGLPLKEGSNAVIN